MGASAQAALDAFPNHAIQASPQKHKIVHNPNWELDRPQRSATERKWEKEYSFVGIDVRIPGNDEGDHNGWNNAQLKNDNQSKVDPRERLSRFGQHLY